MNFQKLLPHLVALVVFLGVVFFTFSPAFSGKVLRQSDVVAHRAISKEAADYQERTGDRALWSNSQFGGMPTYQTTNIRDGNQIAYIAKITRGLVLPYPADIFFAAMLCAYLMFILLGVNPWLSIVGALAFSLVTNNLILFETGHNTKIRTIAYFPLIVAGIVMAWQKRYLFGGLIFAAGMSLSLFSNHPQMVYYLGLTVPIFGIAMLVETVRTKNFEHFGKAVGVLLLGLLLAIGSAASNILPTLDYKDSTMRGTPILEKTGGGPATSSSETEGLQWDYAMNWSNNIEDLIATAIPRAAGGGSGEEISRGTPFGKAFTRVGARLPETFQAPTYHGKQPFTSGPRYLGAVVWLLFILGIVALSGPVKWWLAGGTFLAFLLSMGSEAEWLNRTLYNHLPLFNTFRSPSSALTAISVLVGGLGFLGLSRWLKTNALDKEKAKKQLFIGGGIALGVSLLLVLIGPSLMDFSQANDAASIQRMVGQGGDQNTVNALVTALEDTRAEIFRADALRTFLFMAAAAAGLFLFWRGTFSVTVLAGILAVLVMADFVGVNNRYIDKSDYKSKRVFDQSFEQTTADKQILQDPDPYYRVYNTTAPDPFQDGLTGYYHKSVGGYHPAKLQRYQDLIDRHLGQGNQAVFNMLNTKYYIVNGGQGVTAQRNPNALGNAWIVSNIQRVNSANEEIDALGGNFDPATTAVVHQEWNEVIAGLNPTGEGNIQLTSYDPNELKYSFNSNADQLVVFSEIWYGPDTGWKATIDGQEQELIRANYALRALRVPAGQHEIVMTFAPASYSTGYVLSLISSLIILLGLIAYGFFWYRKRERRLSTEVAQREVLDAPAARPVKPRKKKRK